MDLRPLPGLGVDLRRIHNTTNLRANSILRVSFCLIFVMPTVIIYPLDYLPVANSKQEEMLYNIVWDVARCCDIGVKYVSFKDLWLKSPPKDAAGTTLHDFLQGVSSPSNQTSTPKSLNRQGKIRLSTTFPKTPMISALLTSRNMTECLLRTRLHIGDGSMPTGNVFGFVNSSSHNREVSSGTTLAQRNDAMRRMEIYKDWLLHEVLRVDDETALVVLPIKDVEPNYRDTDPGYVSSYLENFLC